MRGILTSATRRTPAAPTVTYYVDTAGNDANAGTSTGAAWASIAKVNSTALASGAAVLFKRGQTFSGGLVCDNFGVTYGAYGTGNPPVISGSAASADPITVTGAFVMVQDLRASASGATPYPVGIRIYGTDAIVQRCASTGNAAGIAIESGAHRGKVLYSNVFDNDVIVSPSGPDDDFGAFGVVIAAADDCEVAYNSITGHLGSSPDYGQDGAAVEIYGAIRANVHHNTCVDNQCFSEVGDARSLDNTFHHNLIVSSVTGPPDPIALNLQGTGTFGPVLDTAFYHNTVVLTGSGSIGVIVGSGATLSLHNNVFNTTYGGATGSQKIDEGHNVYTGDTTDLWSSANSGTGIASTSVANTAAGFLGSGDYRLASGSTAINRGASLGYAVDLDGLPRAVGVPDAGAYEYLSSLVTTSLVDPFDAWNINKWTLQTGAEITGGRLSVPCTTAYAGANAVPLQNLTGRSVLVELVQVPAVGNGTTGTILSLGPNGPNTVQFVVENGQLMARSTVSGSTTTRNTATYSSSTHRWLRISEASGTITWWTSTNGTAWTSFTTWAMGGAFAVTACELVLFAGYYGTETSPGPAVFDNLNLPAG